MTDPRKTTPYEQGFADGKAEAADTIAKLQKALDKALAENLANRPKSTHLDAVARQGSHASIAR